MRQLTEQEKLAFDRAWCNYDALNPDIDEMRAMQAGFVAGVEYGRVELLPIMQGVLVFLKTSASTVGDDEYQRILVKPLVAAIKKIKAEAQ